MGKLIIRVLREHAPFTVAGAFLGILFLFVSQNLPRHFSHELFYVFHPLHVLLSALTTASIYRLHTCPKGGKSCNLPLLLIIGYVGSIGIATLSDSIMPYLGEILLDLPYRSPHIGFIEKWWLISAVAIIGVMISYFNPATKFPHSAHVLISTWASIFHIMMAINARLSFVLYMGILVFLFLSVWVPCCFSDIIFPLLFVKNGKITKCTGEIKQ
ncbi:MAG: hypothetical protein ABH872_04460 [Candidatus Omnitrophota bacterium]